MENFFKKYLYRLLLLLFLIFFILITHTPASYPAKREKINVVVMPIEAQGLEPEIYKSLTNAFIRKLKKNEKYNFIKQADDDFDTILALLTSVLKEGDMYFLNTKIFNTESGAIVAHGDIECKKCEVHSLKKKIEDLANRIQDVKQNTLKREELIEVTFKRLEEMDKVDNSLFPPKKKIKAWQDFLKKYTEKNLKKEGALQKIELLKIDASFMEASKSASQADSLNEQEKLWMEFISKYGNLGRQSTIQNAKEKLENIISARKEKERKERRYRRRRRLKKQKKETP